MRQTQVFELKSHQNNHKPPLSRSEVMARVHSKDTRPEKSVRSLLHAMGYRFRLHRRDLPGSPDIAFPSRKAVIFVHGCFWHGHKCKRGDRVPKNNMDYWIKKRTRNMLRDKQNKKDLESLGWKVLVVWECELKDLSALKKKLIAFLNDFDVKKCE